MGVGRAELLVVGAGVGILSGGWLEGEGMDYCKGFGQVHPLLLLWGGARVRSLPAALNISTHHGQAVSHSCSRIELEFLSY
ncbi:hypothetical protein TNCV_2785201 [Trichonephila clavipes]|nr:hypothetical protein TNCV_2785201 [Trichonephila clavipes]